MATLIKTRIIAVIVVLSAVLGFAGANEELLKTWNGKNIGGVILNKETMFADSRGVGRTFYITVTKDADYFIAVVTNGVTGKEFEVTLDFQSFVEGKVKLENGWKADFVLARESSVPKSLRLSKGEHSISFVGKGPRVPAIERIRIAETEESAKLSADDLIALIQAQEKKPLPPDFFSKKAGLSSNSNQAMAAAYSTPPYYYWGIENVSFNYSYCDYFYLNAGQTATFQTENTSGADPVMHIFFYANPQQFSACDDDGGGYPESRISFTVPVTGGYIILVRDFYAYGSTGYSTIRYNGNIIANQVGVGGKMFDVSGYTSSGGELNYFTTKPRDNIDTRLFLFTPNNSVAPVNAYNDDYYGSGDFNWGRLSRIKKTFNAEIKYCLITHYSAGQSGTCDFYAKCQNTTTGGVKPDDGIRSAGSTDLYNCFAWSGGIHLEKIGSSDPRWKAGNDELQFFINYYNNYPVFRYANAVSYPHCVHPSTPGVEVDLWWLNNYVGYSHASCTKPANDHMHGYDWESKWGHWDRFFHPRYSVEGNGIGYVVYSFKRAEPLAVSQNKNTKINQDANYGCAVTTKSIALGITRPLSLDSSIILGLTVLRNVTFNDDEKNKNTSLIDKIPADLRNDFVRKYAAWEKSWSDPAIPPFGNPRVYAKSDEYDSLKNFCIEKGKKIWPLLFDKAQENTSFAPLLLEEVLLDSSKKEMQTVNDQVVGNRFTPDGAFIYTTNKDRWVSLCKILLTKYF